MKKAEKTSDFPDSMADISPRGYSTEQFAALMHIRANTLRHALCTQGHYYGVRPKKLPNGYLSWPICAVDALAGKQ